jgi:hypothetical protein
MKKATTLIVFMCLANAFLTAQNAPIKFGISVNTNYSHRYVYTNDAAAKAMFDRLYSGKFSYSIGAFVEKEITRRGRLRIGLNAMNTGFQIVKNDLQGWGSQNGGWNPFPPEPNDPTKIRFVYNFINLELPIDYQYFINKKRSFYLDFGVSPMLNLYNYITTQTHYNNKNTTTNQQELTDEPMKKLSLALQFGMGYAVKLTRRLTLDIQPRIQGFVTPLISSSSKSGVLPYNIGLQTGLTF